MQNYPDPNQYKQDICPEEFVDIDNFLDNYLVQLQSDTLAQQTHLQQQHQLQQQGNLPSPGVVAADQRTPNALGMQGVFPHNILTSPAAYLTGFPGVGFPSNGVPSYQFQDSVPMHPMQRNFGLVQQQSTSLPVHSAPLQPAANAVPAVPALSAPNKKGTNSRKAKSSAKQSRTSTPPEDDSAEGLSCGDSASSDGEQKSRKKREVSNDDDMTQAERRHLALQEKNRRAQRRFRERQKTKIQELHKQIEELTSKVGNLQTENAALHSRTSILEKVLDMRNEQIQVMQESKEAGPALDPEPEVVQSSLTLTGMSGQVINLTLDMLKELSQEQIYKIYQQYIKELSARLVESSKGGYNAEVQHKVDTLTQEISYLLMRLSVVRPIETRKFIAVSRQNLASEAEAIQMWAAVVKSLGLSEQQKTEVVQWKQLFMHKVEPIVEERKKLNVQIQAHLPQESFHTRNAITYIKTHEAVAKLRENLRAEHNVTLEFCAAVFKGILTPTQMANLLVQAYPAVPDALAVASAVITDMSEKGQHVPPSLTSSTMRQLEASLLGAPSYGNTIGAVTPAVPQQGPSVEATTTFRALTSDGLEAASSLEGTGCSAVSADSSPGPAVMMQQGTYGHGTYRGDELMSLSAVHASAPVPAWMAPM